MLHNAESAWAVWRDYQRQVLCCLLFSTRMELIRSAQFVSLTISRITQNFESPTGQESPIYLLIFMGVVQIIFLILDADCSRSSHHRVGSCCASFADVSSSDAFLFCVILLIDLSAFSAAGFFLNVYNCVVTFGVNYRL